MWYGIAWLCCAVLCCAVLCCAVLCCAVLCCAVLCCAVLRCDMVLLYSAFLTVCVLFSESQIKITDNNAMGVAMGVEKLTSVPEELNSRNVSTAAEILRKIVDTNATNPTVSTTLNFFLKYSGILNMRLNASLFLQLASEILLMYRLERLLPLYQMNCLDLSSVANCSFIFVIALSSYYQSYYKNKLGLNFKHSCAVWYYAR